MVVERGGRQCDRSRGKQRLLTPTTTGNVGNALRGYAVDGSAFRARQLDGIVGHGEALDLLGKVSVRLEEKIIKVMVQAHSSIGHSSQVHDVALAETATVITKPASLVG